MYHVSDILEQRTVFSINTLHFRHPTYESVPRSVNVGFGQVAGWGAYILGKYLIIDNTEVIPNLGICY